MVILKGPARQPQSCQHNPPTWVEPICEEEARLAQKFKGKLQLIHL